MSITINTTPGGYEPVYTNSIPFIITSTFQGEENFKYLFKLYNEDTSSLLTTIATYPRPNGTGIYSPHYVLQANCNTPLRPPISSITEYDTARILYYVKFGEQYNPGLTFADTDLSTSYLGLTFSTNISTDLFVGDIISIQKENIAINPWVNGTASITSVTSNYSVMTDKLIPAGYITSSGESGNITNLSRIVATSGIYVGWNAVRQYEELNLDFESIYVMRDPNNNYKFLSSYETSYSSTFSEAKPIYINNYETLDILLGTYSFPVTNDVIVNYEYYDSTGSSLGNEGIITTSVASDSLRCQVPTGTQNIFDIGGLGSTLITAGTLDHYSIQIFIGSDEVSDIFNYQIIPFCRPYVNVRIAFLNKLGGYDYWNFNLVSKYTSDIQRVQINRALSPQYSKGNRGRDVIYSSAVENWTINTDLLTDTDALFIRELCESSSVFIVEDDGTTIPIVITTNNWEFKSGLLNGAFNYTITFQKSNDVYINR